MPTCIPRTRTADDAPSIRLGRIRGVHLPIEYQLEKLTRGIQNQHSSWSTNTPACEWNGVKCDDGEVVHIDWSNRKLRGTLDWKWIPKTVKGFNVLVNEIEGTLELSSLPRALEKLFVGSNKLSGSLHFSDLPPKLLILNLSDNDFTGHADLLCLPSELKCMKISDNKELSGTLCMENIPQTLTYRNVDNTNINVLQNQSKKGD